MSSDSKAPRYGVPALDKGLDILEMLATSRTPLNRSELARALGKSPSEIFRMLDCLERRRYLEKDSMSGHYRLTLRLFEMAHTHSPVEHLLRIAEPHLNGLVQEIDESCHLTVLQGDSTIVVGRALSAASVRLSVEIGHKLPALHTVSGRILVAWLPPEQRDRWIEGNPEFQSMGCEAKRSVLAKLDTIRAQGYVLAKSEYRTGVDLAVLVGNPAVAVSAALAVPCMAGGKNDGREEELIPRLLGCAGDITDALGLTVHNGNR